MKPGLLDFIVIAMILLILTNERNRDKGITKLNTTAYHRYPQCDGMVERINRTLKSLLRKHAVKFNNQWDRYFQKVLWAYWNTPHEATGKEKPTYLPTFCC